MGRAWYRAHAATATTAGHGRPQRSDFARPGQSPPSKAESRIVPGKRNYRARAPALGVGAWPDSAARPLTACRRRGAPTGRAERAHGQLPQREPMATWGIRKWQLRQRAGARARAGLPAGGPRKRPADGSTWLEASRNRRGASRLPRRAKSDEGQIASRTNRRAVKSPTPAASRPKALGTSPTDINSSPPLTSAPARTYVSSGSGQGVIR